MSYGNSYPTPPPPDYIPPPSGMNKSPGIAILGVLVGLALCVGAVVLFFTAFAVSYNAGYDEGGSDGEALSALLLVLGLALPVVVPGILVFFRRTRWFALWMFIAIPLFFIAGPLACTAVFAGGAFV